MAPSGPFKHTFNPFLCPRARPALLKSEQRLNQRDRLLRERERERARAASSPEREREREREREDPFLYATLRVSSRACLPSLNTWPLGLPRTPKFCTRTASQLTSIRFRIFYVGVLRVVLETGRARLSRVRTESVLKSLRRHVDESRWTSRDRTRIWLETYTGVASS